MKSVPDRNKALMQSFFGELDQNAAIDIFFTAGCRAHLPGNPEPADGEGFRQFVGMLYTAFPDLTHKIELQAAEGNITVTLLTARGTHKGDFQVIPATGKEVAITDIIITRAEQDKIIELLAQFDVWVFLPS